MNCSKLVSDIFYIRTQASLLHYQTKAYARHTAYGEFYDSFYDLSDNLIEDYIGKYRDVKLEPMDTSIEILNIDEFDINDWVRSIDEMFQDHKNNLSMEDGDLSNIIDEIQGTISKLRYKLLLEKYEIPKHKKIFKK